MRVRTFVRQPNGTKLLLSSIPAHLKLDRSKGELAIKRAAPMVDCSTSVLPTGLEFVHPCNSRQSAALDPTDVAEFNQGVADFYSSVATAPPPTPVPGLGADSILVERVSLPTGLTSYEGDPLISFDKDNTGRIVGGVVSGEGGTYGGFRASADPTPILTLEVTGADGSSVEVMVGPDGPAFSRDVDLLRSGNFMTTDCWTEFLSMAYHTAGWASSVFALGYMGAGLYTTRVAWTATISGVATSGPARRGFAKHAWAFISGAAAGVADIWEGMHNAIQDWIHC